MILLSMIETTKTMVEEFNRLIKNEEIKKTNKKQEWKNCLTNNDPKIEEVWEDYKKSDNRIGALKIAIQKAENLLHTLNEIKNEIR